MKTPKGIVNAILPPFVDSGRIDHPMLEKLTQFQIDTGLQGPFESGPTGEGFAVP